MKVEQIAIGSIAENTNNPRSAIGPVDDLKASIGEHGLIQPIAVRRTGPRNYEVIAGSRRLRACRELGMETVPCQVIDVDEARAYELATAENIVRENMTAVDEANAVAKLFEQGKGRAEIGAMFGKSARWAEGRRRIVALGGKAMKMLAEGKMNLGHAEALTMCRKEDVEKWLPQVTWKSPEELRTAIMNEKPLLERAPFNARRACAKCDKRSGCQKDLFDDVQNDYCLDRECFEKKVKAEAERIRKGYLSQGYEEVPADDLWDAQNGYGGWVDADADDEDEEPEGDMSFEGRMRRLDYGQRNRVREDANAEERRIVADKLKAVFGSIRNDTKAFILALIGRSFEDDEGTEKSYLSDQYRAASEFLEEVADEITGNWSGTSDEIREFLKMDSREDFELAALDNLEVGSDD